MQVTVCQHDEEEKCFTDTWTLDELAYSLTLDYKIKTVFEAYVYTEMAPIYKDYLESFARYKVIVYIR